MSDPIRVFLVDDHEMFAEALALLFGRHPEIDLLAALPAGEEAVARCRDEHPDVVLMDVGLPGMDGIEATKRIRRASPGTRVVLLTAMQSPTLIVSAGEVVMADDDRPVALDEPSTKRSGSARSPRNAT